MADRISEDEIAMLMRAFNKHDTDGDGVISTAELAKVLHSLGQNPTDAELQGTTLSEGLKPNQASLECKIIGKGWSQLG